MKIGRTFQAFRGRLRHPAMWLGALALPLVQTIPLSFLHPGGELKGLPLAPSLLAGFTFWCLSVLLVGIPLQWTGDDRHQTGFIRGTLQWCVLEVLVLAVASLVFWMLLPPGLKPKQIGIMVGLLMGVMFGNGFLLFIMNWVVVRAETQEAEIAAEEARAQASERLTARQTLSPRTIHGTLASLLKESNPVVLERGLVDLAVLFRSRLVQQSQPWVPFLQERQLLGQLLAILQRRHLVPATIEQDWDPAGDTHPCPSLVLVQCAEVLADLLEQCPIKALALSSRRQKSVLEVEIRWQDGASCALSRKLESHPDFLQVTRRVSTLALLREPLELHHLPGGGRLNLHLPEVQP